MFETVFWTVGSLLAVTFLASLTWLLWTSLKRLFRSAAQAGETVGAALGATQDKQDLLDRGIISIPREADAFEDSARVAELKAERYARKNLRANRKATSRMKAYRRWVLFNQ
jgi:hypothetical protein